jgi:hypothetical protein
MNMKSGWLGVVSNLVLSSIYHVSAGCAPIMTTACTHHSNFFTSDRPPCCHPLLASWVSLLAHHLTPLPVMLLLPQPIADDGIPSALLQSLHSLPALDILLASPVVLSPWC